MQTPDQITIEALQEKLARQYKLIQKLSEDQFNDPGVGGNYILNEWDKLHLSELVLTNNRVHDEIHITWSDAARIKFRVMEFSSFDARYLMSLPTTIKAQGWWHLCAQLGIKEPHARLFYGHPENGQPSATRSAKPFRRGAVISCEGDYID